MDKGSAYTAAMAAAVDAIAQLTDKGDIMTLFDALKAQSRRLDQRAVDGGEFEVGDVVRFTGRRKRILTGTVTRLNQRTVTVHCEDAGNGVPGDWRVHAGGLTHVDRSIDAG
tara:strand:- start:1396 stop:1731 length:336 start_codon:yes stop_codon:yes gene_type:complete